MAGNVPPKANLGNLRGLAEGLNVGTTGMVRPILAWPGTDHVNTCKEGGGEGAVEWTH